MINRVILTGRLTNDIELRRTADGTPYTFFTIAVNRRNNENTDFISCVAWRQTAELINQYLNKGSLIGIEGRLEVYSRQNNGNYETRTNVQVSTITFLETKSQAQQRTSEQSSNIYQQEEKNNQEMTFYDEPKIDQSETTPINNETKKSFGKAEEINANDINLDEIKF